MKTIKLAIGQIKPKLGDLKYNLEHHIEFAEQAKDDGAHLILFPELSLTGYSVRDLNAEVALGLSDKYFDALKLLSNEISIAVGSIIRDENGGIRNSLIYFEDGTIKHVHYKVYLPTYGIFEEQRYFLPGKEVIAFDTKFGKLGLLICEDLWHVSLPYILAVQGVKLILVSAASPTRLSGGTEEDPGYIANSEQHKSFARLLSIYLAFANRVGFEDGVNFWGGSEVVSPHGEIVSKVKLFDEDVIYSEIDFAEIERARLFARHFLDENPQLLAAHLKELGY
ncbi:MAG: nitrilase-related carbon-nitrogen hydrolase [Candidatus Kryptoniota bacterium]